MKRMFLKLCISVVLLSIMVSCNEKTVSETSNDVLGESSSDGGRNVGAISFALGTNGGYVLKEGSKYKTPEVVDKLPAKMNLPPPGPQESVDEVPSNSEYYDGSTKLNVVTVQCRIYADTSKCLSQSSCGWCGDNHSCINGNNLGPLEPCKQSSYVFSAPYPNWNPQTRVINENVGGVALTLVNK